MQPTKLSTQWSQRLAGREAVDGDSRRARRSSESDDRASRRADEVKEPDERRSELRVTGRRLRARNWPAGPDTTQSAPTTTVSDPAATDPATSDPTANDPAALNPAALNAAAFNPAASASATGAAHANIPSTAPGIALTPSNTPPGRALDAADTTTTVPVEPVASTAGEVASGSTSTDATSAPAGERPTWDVAVPRDPVAAVQPFPFAQPSGTWASVSRSVLDGPSASAPALVLASGGLRMQGTAFRIDRSQSTRPQSALGHDTFALQMERAAARYAAMSALTQLVTRNEKAIRESLTTSQDGADETRGVDGLA